MLPKNFSSLVIITCTKIATYIFNKQKYKLLNCKTTTRVSRHRLARIFILLCPDTAARGQLSNKNQL